MDPNTYSDPNDQYRQLYRQMLMSRAAAPAQAQPDKGNFFTHALPTIGGVLGGLVSLPTEALNAFLPGAGVAANLAAAGAGSSAGKGLENLLEGNSATSGLGSSFFEGAGGQALGGIGGKMLGGVFGRGAGRAAETATTDLTGTTPQTALKLSTSGRLGSAANDLLASQYKTISKPVARAVNLPQVVGQLADMGLIKPSDVEQVANGITGSNGLLNQAVVKAIGGANRVDTGGLRQIVSDAIDNNGLVDSDAKSVRNIVEAHMKRLEGGPTGGATINNGTGAAAIEQGAHPAETLSVMQAVEGHMRDLLGKGGTYHLPTAQDIQKARSLGLFRDELQDRLYGAAGGNGQVSSVLTPELRQQLVDLAPGNPTWAGHVDNNIMTQSEIGGLRAAQKPFVQISKAINEGELNSPTFGGRLSNGDMPTKTQLIGAALSSAPAKRVGATALRAASAATGGEIPQAAKIAGRAAAQGITHASDFSSPQQAMAAGPTDPTAPTDFSSPGAAMGGTASGVGSAGGMFGASPGQPGLSGFSDQQLSQALHNDVAKNNGRNVDDIIKLMNVNLTGRRPLGIGSNTQQALTSTDHASAVVDQLEQLYGQNGAQGPLGGRVAEATAAAGLNPGVTSYNAARQGYASEIARALSGDSGNLSDTDIARAMNLLPAVTDTKEVAATKMAGLRSMIAHARETAMRYAVPASPSQVDFSQLSPSQ